MVAGAAEEAVQVGAVPQVGGKRMKHKPEDLNLIEAAVQKAELKTSGEIVPVISDKCSNTSFIFPFLFLLFLCGAILLQQVYYPWNLWDKNIFWQLSLSLAVSLVLSFVLAQLSMVQRFFIPKRRREKEVQDQAELAFHRWISAKTEGKTGILIFVSLMERYSVVLGDEAISKKLPAETWSEVLKLLNSKMDSKSISTSFVPAIEKCGNLLSEHFPRDPHDTDELSNYPLLRWDDE